MARAERMTYTLWASESMVVIRPRAQGRLLRGVALDLEEAFPPGPGERFGQDVDDDDLEAGMDELARDRQPDPAVAAQDVVARKLADCVDHSPGLPPSAGRLHHKVLGHDPDRAEDQPDSQEREDHRPDTPGVGERLNLSEADGGQGDHRHVERVERPPARFDDQIPARADDDGGDNYRQPDPNVSGVDRGGC
jgi:hypothetical protein